MRLTLPDGSVRRLEELASGTALGEWARQRLQTSAAPSTLRGLDLIDGQAVGEAAAAGDKLAGQVVAQAGEWLGLGLVNLMHLFNPAAIVLGGSAMKLGDLLLDAGAAGDARACFVRGLPPAWIYCAGRAWAMTAVCWAPRFTPAAK